MIKINGYIMSIIFTLHARKRMDERGVSAAQIRECILSSDKAWTEEERTYYFQKFSAHGTLEIVAERKGKHYVVITVYYL